jgi:hypothetical protein
MKQEHPMTVLHDTNHSEVFGSPIHFNASLPLNGSKKQAESVKSCFGTIYPDLDHFQFGKPLVGKVFQISIDCLGANHRDRKMKIDLEAWHDCQLCEDFRNCYDFSTAKLQMQRVLREL